MLQGRSRLASHVLNHPSFPLFYPRKYREPTGWYSPKFFAAAACVSCDQFHSELTPSPITTVDTSATMHEVTAYCHLLANKVPTWWVGEDLFLSLLNSSCPPDMRLVDVKFPTPALLFMLPMDACQKALGCNVGWLVIAKIPLGTTYLVPQVGAPRQNLVTSQASSSFPDAKGVVVCASGVFTGDAESEGAIVTRMPLDDSVKLSFYALMIDELGMTYDEGSKVNPSDEKNSVRLNNLALQLLLLLAMRQESVTGGNVLIPARTTGKGDSKIIHEPTLFDARWIGKNYRRPTKPPAGGTHASPLMHLRRGHWRAQRCGPGYGEVKTLWIEPAWVNAL